MGHNSKAVHRAYAKRAQVRVPSLEKYERSAEDASVIALQFQQGELIEATLEEQPAVAQRIVPN